jgi:hypothetical protein
MGGGAILSGGHHVASAVAVVGVAPVSSPEWVNTTTPRNLLLIISTGDAVINATTVTRTFYRSVNGTLGVNTPHNISGTQRELFVVEGVDHLNILYHAPVIGEIVKWSTRHVIGAEQALVMNPTLIHVSAYVSLAGGALMILAALSLAYRTSPQRRRRSTTEGHTDRRALVKIGIAAIVLAGFVSPFPAIGLSLALGYVTPLFFTNFITALFLSNAIMFALLARTALKRRNEERSYVEFIKESIRTPSVKVNAGLGAIGAAAFIALLASTLGQSTTSTLSMASTRLLALPLYVTLFAIVFVLYESFFKGVVRSRFGGGRSRVVYAFFFELAVLFATFVLELMVLTVVLSFVMPYMQLGLFVLGLNFLLVALVISLASAEVFFERTGGWVTQILISAVTFATLTVVFSPALRPFS